MNRYSVMRWVAGGSYGLLMAANGVEVTSLVFWVGIFFGVVTALIEFLEARKA